jgi:hypothetical protein
MAADVTLLADFILFVFHAVSMYVLYVLPFLISIVK